MCAHDCFSVGQTDCARIIGWSFLDAIAVQQEIVSGCACIQNGVMVELGEWSTGDCFNVV